MDKDAITYEGRNSNENTHLSGNACFSGQCVRVAFHKHEFRQKYCNNSSTIYAWSSFHIQKNAMDENIDKAPVQGNLKEKFTFKDMDRIQRNSGGFVGKEYV